MKTGRLAVTLTLGLGLCLGLLRLLAAVIPAAGSASQAGHIVSAQAPTGELHVCPSRCAYSSVQAAVDAAKDGDIIKVAAGTYTGTNTYGGFPQMVYISKTVIVQGGYTTDDWALSRPSLNHTTLDAEGLGRVIYITGDIQPVIEGLRITRGEAEGLGAHPGEPVWDGGGGLSVLTATAVIRNNHIFGNSCSSQFCAAGGLLLVYSHATVTGNTFYLNTATWDGGGLQALFSDATVSGNKFESNSVDFGGGAVYLHMSAVAFSNNVMISNTAKYGGGLVSSIGTDLVVNNVFIDNHVDIAGGGLWIYGSSPQLLHNTIARNDGGDGSGVYVSQVDYVGPYTSSAALTNTILSSHAIGISVAGGNAVTVNGILWHDSPITVSHSVTAHVTMRNQHSGDPAFGQDGFHLTAHSGAIDKGTVTHLAADIDGEARPSGTGHDIGADEFWYTTNLPVIVRRN